MSETKTYRLFPKIGSAPMPGQLPKALLIQADTPEQAVLQAKARHKRDNPFSTVSDWTAVEERP